MGDVYVAHDLRLDRRVALKIPRQGSTSVDRLALVQREARAAAALNHPNIVHLYAVEEADGVIFMTWPSSAPTARRSCRAAAFASS